MDICIFPKKILVGLLADSPDLDHGRRYLDYRMGSAHGGLRETLKLVKIVRWEYEEKSIHWSPKNLPWMLKTVSGYFKNRINKIRSASHFLVCLV